MESSSSSPEKDTYEINSNKTLVLWTNFIPLDEDGAADIHSSNVRKLHREIVYKSPRGLSENYLQMIRKAASKLVHIVIKISEWSVQNYLKPYRPYYGAKVMAEDKNKMANLMNYMREYMDVQLLESDSECSLLAKTGWLDKNEFLDGFSAIPTIFDYIKNSWALDAKYLFTVEKTDTSMSNGLTRHSYKVEFSVPTKEYPIPQVTVSAYFTVDVSLLLSIPIYIKYQLEMDRRVYEVGSDPFNKNRFERLFEIKRDVYMDINKYPGWSSWPGSKS